MSQFQNTILLENEAATQSLASHVSAYLTPGDVLLLFGDIGAGKSVFARAVIHALQEEPSHVPSPTFTLVQTYNTSKGDVWHADLYRITHSEDVLELGLSDAMETAICLIEWPENLGHYTPENQLQLHFEAIHESNERRLTVHADENVSQKLVEAFHA